MNAAVDERSWLLLVYKIPSAPTTRQRAAVWRRLRAAGAVYLQNGIAALPATTSAQRTLRSLQHEIVRSGASALLMTCTPLTPPGEVVAAYNAVRDDEYEELAEQCRDVEREVRTAIGDGRVTFATFDAAHEDLDRLRRALDRVREHDLLDATAALAAAAAFARAEDALDELTARLYDSDGAR